MVRLEGRKAGVLVGGSAATRGSEDRRVTTGRVPDERPARRDEETEETGGRDGVPLAETSERRRLRAAGRGSALALFGPRRELESKEEIGRLERPRFTRPGERSARRAPRPKTPCHPSTAKTCKESNKERVRMQSHRNRATSQTRLENRPGQTEWHAAGSRAGAEPTIHTLHASWMSSAHCGAATLPTRHDAP